MRRTLPLLLAATVCQLVMANEYLPSEAQAKRSILESPQVLAAYSKQQALINKADVIANGTAEFTVRASGQRRRVDEFNNNRYFEHQISIERPIRYWNKWNADIALADATKSFANIEYADAIHEASKELLGAWFNYIKAIRGRTIAQQNLEYGQQISKITQTRFKVGEVAQLDTQLTAAELGRLQAAFEIAKAQASAAMSLMKNRYPTIVLAQDIQLDAIPNDTDDQDKVRIDFLNKNHELNMLKLDAERYSMIAKRTELERIPDPTIGLFNARERGGSEIINGISISIPIPSSARTSYVNVAQAESLASKQRVLLVTQKLSSEFDGLWQQVQSKRVAAEVLQSSATIQKQAALKAQKAYALGEGTVTDLIVSRKTANENQYQADMMSIEAIEAYYQLKLDMHDIWDFD